MSLSKVSVHRPIGTLTIAVAVIVFGVVAVTRLAVDLLPSVDAPRLSITTRYEGVAPQEMETLITRPIEQAVSTIEGVTELTASSSESLSRVQLRFEWGHDLESAAADVREMLDRIRARLPEDADPPTIYKFDLAEAPIASLGLSGKGDARRLRYLADEVLSRRLERVAGVARADVRGGRIREVEVRLEAGRLTALNISPAQVTAALQGENRNVSAGDMRSRGREVVIRTEGEFTSAKEIENVVVTTREGRPIRVADLGEVADTFQELQSELWVDGEPGIRIQISKQSGTNTVEVVEGLRREIAAINADYDGRLTLTVLSDNAEFIRAAVTNVQSSVLYGAGLAVFVLLFFLRNLRATLVVATAIPISVLATFALMFWADVSLNVISMGGLALGVGMLVDGAIVILESIYRKREEGHAVVASAIEGTGEVAAPVVAGALTTAAVFVPVVFIAGFAGVFFREMALVVVFALVCSVIVALTVVPALAALLMSAQQRPAPAFARRLSAWSLGAVEGLENLYGRTLGVALDRRWWTIGGALLLLAVAGFGGTLIRTELMPETDEGMIDIDIELPVGTPLETTMEVMKDLERQLVGTLRPGELAHVTTVAGPEASWRPGGSNEGEVEITLVPVTERERSVDEVMEELRKVAEGVPGADVRARKSTANMLFRIMRGGADRLAVEIRGHDLDTADALAERVKATMREVPGVAHTFVDREPGQLEQSIRVDRARLGELGLSGAQVAEAVEHYVLGRVATRLRDGGAEYDIRVRLREEDRRDLSQLFALPLPLPDGGTVPLGAVARVEDRSSPTSISRLNQERVVRVSAGIQGRPLGAIAEDVQQKLRGLEVPEGFAVVVAGEQQEQAETFNQLLVGILLALFLVYAVMVVQFESLKQPFIVMTSVPFAMIGAVGVMLATGTTFNMNSFLGVIVLVGIVVNNAIILVDYTNLLRTRGLGAREALMEAGRRRLRPVLMTTLTTVLGMVPLALGLGEGSEIQAPLARVVVGGLIASTLVTLVFVPALYLVMERRPRKEPMEGNAPVREPSGAGPRPVEPLGVAQMQGEGK